MKILYHIDSLIEEETCNNCKNYNHCEFSLYIDDIKEKFGVTKCKDYKYQPPTLIYESNDKEFCDKVVKLILEHREKFDDKR